MPRRNKADNLDFEIHVDPSCLSEPMVDTEPKGQVVPEVEIETKVEDQPQPVAEPEPSLDNTPEEHTPTVDELDITEEAAPESDEAVEDILQEYEQTTEGVEESVEEHSYSSETRRDSALSFSSHSSDRRASVQDMVDQINEGRRRESFRSSTTTDGDFRGRSRGPSARGSDAYMSQRGSHYSMDGHQDYRATVEDADNNSSHHENDDDVFSDDHSPRSSMGSVSESEHQRKPSDIMSHITTRSKVSRMSRYDQEDEEFVPTIRGTPRPAFRSPSSVKALQMSSPPASVYGSPRSSRRTPLPTISRLGSPSVSAQFSPKKTPPRFKRETPPLVLLHVTLLPLRWVWGDVLNAARTDELSRDCKTVRDAWNQLQDRMGDTTVERGILLPHPQSDYEVLEERLLEALELPMRRRARILECGHYLGPSNEFTLTEDDSDEEEDYDYDDDTRSSRQSISKRTHWCNTCRSEIRYDSLGVGKIFRVKVYASNGLMKAGAWEACWKEMERVDVELEPIVEFAVQEELERLASGQEKADVSPSHDDHDEDYEEEPTELHHREESFVEEEDLPPAPRAETPLPQSQKPAKPDPAEEERRRQEEERIREMYGEGPSVEEAQRTFEALQAEEDDDDHQPEPVSAQEPTQRATSKPESAPERRREAYKDASLPQLLKESTRVILQDKKNIIIGLLSILIVMLAVRSGQPAYDAEAIQALINRQEAATVPIAQVPVVEVPVEVPIVELPVVEVHAVETIEGVPLPVEVLEVQMTSPVKAVSAIFEEGQCKVSVEIEFETEIKQTDSSDFEVDAEVDSIEVDATTSAYAPGPKVTETVISERIVFETVTEKETVQVTQWVPQEQATEAVGDFEAGLDEQVDEDVDEADEDVEGIQLDDFELDGVELDAENLLDEVMNEEVVADEDDVNGADADEDEDELEWDL